MVLPQNVVGELCLDGLTSAEGLVLPQSVGGTLYLGGLTSAEGLVLPQSASGDLCLEGLTTADGLMLPENFDLDKIHTKYSLMQEIVANPRKYYRHPETNQNDTFNNSGEDVHKTR